MIISICGSLYFAKEIMELEKQLQVLGHTVILPKGVETFVTGRSNDRQNDQEMNRQEMLDHYNHIAESEAILVTNFEKNNIKGYIGGATLVDMGVACYLRKKIFILNDIPSEDDIRYVQEIKLMKPTIINGDLNKIQ